MSDPSSARKPGAPHVVVVVPDGVGYRNFILGRLPALLPGPVTVLHGLREDALDQSSMPGPLGEDRTQFERLPAFKESPLTRCLREAKSLSQLYRHLDEDAGAIQLARLQPRGRLRNRMLVRAAHTLAKLGAARPERFDAPLSRAVARTSSARAMTDRLRRLNPDVVFCTHQRASAALPVMTAASTLGIPTATFVYSWDNLPKGRMPIQADRYLVWGQTMVDQMRRYFPALTEDQIEEVGTPQFEPYFEVHRHQSKQEFCTELGLDPDRPIVCFSGDDTSTSPKDPQFLEDLAQALREGSDGAVETPESQAPQLVFRRAPVDLSDRYQPVLAEFPEIVDAPPRWHSGTGDWQGILPTNADIDHLVNLVRHSDLVVNLGSTMAMDFAIFDKPAIFLSYEPEGPYDESWNTATAYQLPHFASVDEIGPVHWANSPDQLAQLVKRCLAEPGELRAERRRWLEAICHHPLDQASQRCADALVALGQTVSTG